MREAEIRESALMISVIREELLSDDGSSSFSGSIQEVNKYDV